METNSKLWAHVVLLCFAHLYLGLIVGLVIAGERNVSSWVAATAAFATLIVIWLTLVETRKSNVMLTEQTKAVTGELPPSFNHNGVAKFKLEREIFRFWNYNRRAITIDGIEIVSPPEVSFSSVEFKDKKNSTYKPPASSFQDGGRRLRQTDDIDGTPVGRGCDPATYSVRFFTENQQQHKSRIEVKLKIHWRFRDDDRRKKKETECNAEAFVYWIQAPTQV